MLDAVFRDAADSSADGILLAEHRDGEPRVIYSNGAAAEISGYSGAELAGGPWTLCTGREPEDPDLRPLVEALGQRENAAARLRLRRKGGGEYWAELMLRPIVRQQQTLWILRLRDITGQRNAEQKLEESEKRYRLFFENHVRPVWVYDSLTLRFLEVNRAAIETYGYAREEFLAMSLFDIRPAEDVPLLKEHLAQKRAGEDLASIWRHRRKDGSVLFVEVHSYDLEVNGQPARLAEIIDVSVRRSLEEQLLQAQKMEAIGQLAGGISHDFNNLLTVINGYAALLRENMPEDHPMRDGLVAIGRAGERAAALTHQLLAFSRKQVLQPRVLNLNDLVADMRSMLQRLIREDIELITILNPLLSNTEADPTQMEQVVMNLAINARDAIASNGRITIETSNAEQGEAAPSEMPPGRYVVLSVRDNGKGMDAAIVGRIFEPFFTTKEKGRGTGLGLPTVYGIIKQSGGQITVASTVGEGTEFRVYLPAAAAEAENSPEQPATIGRAPGQGTILLVEDDDAVRQFIGSVLRDLGYHVLDAEDGEHAAEVSNRYPGTIDLLISDVVMPRMSGYELARRLAARRPGLKVLYLSGYSEDTWPDSAVKPFARLLAKPFSPQELASKVQQMLGGAA